MKKTFLVSMFLFFSFIAISAVFAQQASPVPSVVPVVSVPVPAPAPGFVDFVKAHIPAIALVVYGVLDLLILAVPSLDGNGLLHQLKLWAGKLSGQQPPVA